MLPNKMSNVDAKNARQVRPIPDEEKAPSLNNALRMPIRAKAIEAKNLDSKKNVGDRPC